MNRPALSPAPDGTDHVAALEREVEKLRRINAALMDRVERSMDFQGSAFSLFQTAIVLESKVRDRTRQLEETMRALEASHAEIADAKVTAETAQLRLQEAIESVNEGFALFDEDDRLVLCNRTYLGFFPAVADRILPGISFAEIAEMIARDRAVPDAVTVPDRWMTGRLARHADAAGAYVQALADGRWVQINERRTRDGGVVGIYTDITDVRRRDAQQRARELAEKSMLLQSTLDNIPQGVCVYDRDRTLVAWNEPFVRLLELPDAIVSAGATFEAFAAHNATLAASALPAELLDWSRSGPIGLEHGWPNGRTLMVRRNPMPGGGFVFTFTDISERKRIEEALRDGEARTRLITDSVPAFIAYVDANRSFQFVNRRYEQLYNRPRAAMEGLSMRELLGEREYAGREVHVARVLAGHTAEFEFSIRRRDGVERYFHATYIPHFATGGAVLGFFSLIQNVTDRRLAAEALREANEQLERRVEERTTALTEVNRILQREIAERRAIEEALREAKTIAEQANLSKTKFLAAASHDLLQPLNAARLFVSSLGDVELPVGPATLVEQTDTALSSVEDLLEALLDISKLDAGAVQPEVGDVNVGDLLRHLRTEFQPVAAERGLALRVVGCGAAVRSDPRMLRRILQNFIANALRYTRDGGVLVGCRRTAAGLRIDVIDTGPGIPAERQDEIFEEFRRLDNDAAVSDRGMGLGLAIVRRMSRMLGHEVTLRSAPGRGSTFSVLVPYGRAPRVVAPRRPRLPTALNPFDEALILVIDNEHSILDGMRALLQGWGCRVIVAASRAEALDRLPEPPMRPDAIVADYHLSAGENGLDAVKAIREAIGTDVPAVIVTADRSADIHGSIQAAGLALLTKPTKPAQLRALLAQLVSVG